jgi:hypothetical protein
MYQGIFTPLLDGFWLQKCKSKNKAILILALKLVCYYIGHRKTGRAVIDFQTRIGAMRGKNKFILLFQNIVCVLLCNVLQKASIGLSHRARDDFKSAAYWLNYEHLQEPRYAAIGGQTGS